MQVMLVSHASTIVPHLVNAHLRSFAAVDATDNTMSCHTTPPRRGMYEILDTIKVKQLRSIISQKGIFPRTDKTHPPHLRDIKICSLQILSTPRLEVRTHTLLSKTRGAR